MINMIVACDENRVIGNSKTNTMPWHIKEDLTYFKETTMGHTIIMGKNTFKSIGKKLEGRENIIITSHKDFTAEGCIVCYNIEEVIQYLSNPEVFIIGGGSIYKQFINRADRLYITQVAGKYDGDIHFPQYEHTFKRISASEWKQDPNGIMFRFTIWDR